MRALLDRWFAMWNGDLAIAGEIIAEGVRPHLPKVGMPPEHTIHDPETFAAWISAFRGSFDPAAAFRLELEPFALGDHLVAHWRFTGTWQGGRPPTATAEPGTAVDFTGVDILRVVDGRVAEYWLTDNQLDLYAQLGAAIDPALATPVGRPVQD